MKLLIIGLAVCLAKTAEIVLQSLNASLIAKGERRAAVPSIIAECTLWGLVIYSLWAVIGENGWLMIAYCFGYGAGMLLGSVIESRIAVGTSSIQMIANRDYIDAVKSFLTHKQLGFTILSGRGARDESYVIIVILPRKEVKKTIAELEKLCNNKIFIVASEVSQFTGGYSIKQKKH